MLSFKKIIYALLFFISACGYAPIYSNSTSHELTKQISIQEPKTQDEFILYSHLINRFDDTDDKYILNYEISTSKEDRALNFEGTAHRVEISGYVLFTLKDNKTGAEIISDKEKMYLSYSNSGSTAAILNAEKTTNKQLITLLAEKVADRIDLAFIEKGL